MRADAHRNRARLLDATVALVLEVGGAPARDAVAARAGVGIGTLYRHFPDQQSLLHAVAGHVLEHALAAGEAALAESDSGIDALRAYMHAAVDLGLGALNVIHPLLDAPAWPEQRERAERILAEIIESARAGAQLRVDVEPRDVAFGIIRSCRPLAVGMSADDERSHAHRHVDIFVDGLLQTPSGER